MKEINGDLLPLSLIKRFWYLTINTRRNLSGTFSTLKYEPFVSAIADENEKRSPGRIYIDTFFKLFLPNLIVKKNRISILEFGCGSGYLRRLFTDIGITGKYLGIDIKKHPDFDLYSDQPQLSGSFCECSIEEFSTKDKFDLVISNTVLEHIKDDNAVLNTCKKLLKRNGIQIHIVPSGWSLLLYTWHGWRQYSPARITSLFDGTDITVYALGGFFTFWLHFFAISIPTILFRNDFIRKADFYHNLVHNCLKWDKYLPVFPSFYAIFAQKEFTGEK